MRYQIVSVGRRAKDPLCEAAELYGERLTHYTPTKFTRLSEAGGPAERQALLEALDGAEHIVTMDERGEQLTTRELAKRVERWQRSHKQVTLVVGGADGLHPDVKARAHESLALSKLTLPHRMALMLLLEQLYRAHTILKGEPYHRN